MTLTEDLKLGMIQHIVHDWSMLVRLFENTHPKPSPLNHATERSFLVECRKFANFFKNRRGPLDEDAISRDFISQRFKPKLPVWKAWHDHINRQLMHLSYKRVDNKEEWDGSANKLICAELMSTWDEFLPCIHPKYRAEFATQLKNRGL